MGVNDYVEGLKNEPIENQLRTIRHMMEDNCEKAEYLDIIDESDTYSAIMLYEQICQTAESKKEKAIIEYKDIKRELNLSDNWESIILVLMNMGDEERKKYYNELFRTKSCIGGDEKRLPFVKGFSAACKKIYNDNSYLSLSEKFCKQYIELMISIEQEMKDKRFAERVEFELKEVSLAIKWERIEKYFNFLYEDKQYEVCTYILERIKDERVLFDWLLEEVRKRLLSTPSARMVLWAKEHIEKHDPSYSLEEWIADTEEYNTSKNTINWVKLYVVLEKMKSDLVDRNMGEVDFYAKYADEIKVDAVDLSVDDYCTDLIMFLTEIVQYVLKENWKMVPFLEFIRPVNILDYRDEKNVIALHSYCKYEKMKRAVDIDFIKTQLNEKTMPPRVAVTIYLNTVIRLVYNFREFLSNLTEEREKIPTYFKDYTLYGVINKVEDEEIKDRLIIQLSGIYSMDSHLRRGRNNRSYWKIRNHNKWSVRNLEDLYKLKKNMTCKFTLREFKEASLYVDNISQVDLNIREIRDYQEDIESPIEEIMKWADAIICSGRVTKCKDVNNYIVCQINDIEGREMLAIKLLSVCRCLLNSEKNLKYFLNEIKTKNVNEYRCYHGERDELHQIASKERVQEIRDIGVTILESDISPNLKLEIFKKTAMKVCFTIEEVAQYISNLDEWNDEDSGIEFALVINNGVVKSCVYNSNYELELIEMERIASDFPKNVFACIEKLDYEQEKIVFKMSDYKDQKDIMDILRELANRPSELVSYGMRLQEYSHVILSKQNQFFFGVNIRQAFQYEKHNLTKCVDILECVKSVNPFVQYPERLIKWERSKKRAEWEESYRRLLMQYNKPQNKVVRYQDMCKLYCETPLCQIIPFDTFINDLEEAGGKAQNYCKARYNKI